MKLAAADAEINVIAHLVQKVGGPRRPAVAFPVGAGPRVDGAAGGPPSVGIFNLIFRRPAYG